MLDPEFEPFTEDAIEIRKRMPDLLMMAARIAFGSTELSDAEKAENQARLPERLAYRRHLADIALAKQPPEWGLAPSAFMKIARIAFNNAYSDDLRAEAHAMLKERFVRLTHLVEIGLAAPQTSQRVN